eukprot:8552206-Ditylum_brightwellii.AAC.1
MIVYKAQFPSPSPTPSPRLPSKKTGRSTGSSRDDFNQPICKSPLSIAPTEEDGKMLRWKQRMNPPCWRGSQSGSLRYTSQDTERLVGFSHPLRPFSSSWCSST